MKKILSNQKTLLILSVLAVLSGILCAVFNDMVLFLPIALLAAVFYFDKSNNRIFCIVSSAIMVIINGVGIALGVTYYLFAPASIILAFAIYFAYTNKQSKSDTSFLMAVICGIFTFASYIFLAMIYQNDYSLDGAISFYTNLISYFRDYFVNFMLEAYTTSGIEVTAELLTELFDSQINMIVSYIIIAGFLTVGLSFKLFGYILGKWSENKAEIKAWKFKTSNAFAYCYLILVFASIFLMSSTDILSVVIYNLYNIFLVVYAYVGFNVVKDMLTKKLSPLFASFIIIGALIVFSSLVVQILAVSGVFYTIRTKKEAESIN